MSCRCGFGFGVAVGLESLETLAKRFEAVDVGLLRLRLFPLVVFVIICRIVLESIELCH